jgi:pyruvate carboxylase
LYVNLCYVLQADEAYHIGPPTASQSYLCQDKIINIAKLSGAKVIYFCEEKSYNGLHEETKKLNFGSTFSKNIKSNSND